MSLLSLIRQAIGLPLLYITGWEITNTQKYQILKQEAKLVVLFAHSSYWDFIILLLHMLAIPEIYNDLIVVMKPQPFKYCGSFLTKLGFIAATRKEDHGLGFVEQTTKLLQTYPRFHLILSPKGTIKNREWKSGYYWLAKNLKCKILVVGADYDNKRLKFFEPVDVTNLDYQECEKLLKPQMSQIISLHPDNEPVSVHYNEANLYPFDPLVFFSVILSIYPVYLVYHFNFYLFLLSLLTINSSLLYHRTMETNQFTRFLDLFLTSFNILIYESLILLAGFQWDLLYSLIIFSSFYVYLMGSGREKCHQRSHHYMKYHLLFHFFCSLIISYPLRQIL